MNRREYVEDDNIIYKLNNATDKVKEYLYIKLRIESIDNSKNYNNGKNEKKKEKIFEENKIKDIIKDIIGTIKMSILILEENKIKDIIKDIIGTNKMSIF